MYKSSFFLILFTLVFIFKKVDVAFSSPSPAEPVIVQAHHQDASSSKFYKKHPLTPEQFKKRVNDRLKTLKDAKARVMLLKDKVDASEKSWFELFIKCADKWIEALEAYQSSDTNIYRSYRLANKELKAAKELTALKPTPHQTKAVYPQHDIDKLEIRFNEVKAHADQLNGDNRKAFEAMIYCAGEYISILKATKDHPLSVRRLLNQAMTYVNTAETFVHNRAHLALTKE